MVIDKIYTKAKELALQSSQNISPKSVREVQKEGEGQTLLQFFPSFWKIGNLDNR